MARNNNQYRQKTNNNNNGVNQFWPFRPRFDPVIHLGHVISVCFFIVAGFAAWYGVIGDVKGLGYRVDSVEKNVVTLVDTVKLLTNKMSADIRQDEKLLSIDARITNNERRLDRIEQSRLDENRKDKK